MLEYLKLCLFIVAFTMVFAFVQHDDYHKKFDKQVSIEYNCNSVLRNKLNVPQFVIDECNDGRRIVIVKAYQE